MTTEDHNGNGHLVTTDELAPQVAECLDSFFYYLSADAPKVTEAEVISADTIRVTFDWADGRRQTHELRLGPPLLPETEDEPAEEAAA